MTEIKCLNKVIFDMGKPYEEVFNNEEELKKGLSDFYNINKSEDNAEYDAVVLNELGEDITESQFISEIIGDILNSEENI